MVKSKLKCNVYHHSHYIWEGEEEEGILYSSLNIHKSILPSHLVYMLILTLHPGWDGQTIGAKNPAKSLNPYSLYDRLYLAPLFAKTACQRWLGTLFLIG